MDYFQARGLRCFGPRKGAAQLEGSKAFTKDFLARHNIPTGAYANFTELEPALAYLREQGAPIVVKADGLAAGKGVIVAETLAQAEAAVTDMLSGNAFGAAGCRVVIEEFLAGEEASFIVMVDGKHVLPMATSQDHKRIGEGDTGPNTGGMGAYSPAPVVDAAVHRRVMEQVILPTVAGMAAEGNDYTGFLYAGLMIDAAGQPRVIEYNCRFGDPETQPIMLRLQSDLVQSVQQRPGRHTRPGRRPMGCALRHRRGAGRRRLPGRLRQGHPDPRPGCRCRANDIKVFHAGTTRAGQEIVTSGGRVLCVTALGDRYRRAQRACYEAVDKIQLGRHDPAPGHWLARDSAL